MGITPSPRPSRENRLTNQASTEGGEAPAWQGATTEDIWNTRGRSNAARRDASPAECRLDS
jgi:hypothetical protein